MARSLLRILIAGSVDDGKSTLVGRLLHDSNAVYEDQLESVRRPSSNGLELAFLTDGLRAEREQGITIDVAYRYFSTARRKFILADAPGHDQYTRNMATGASHSEIAIILADARKGVLLQTRRHAYICSLFGIRQIVLAVNKMDLVGFDEAIFLRIRKEFEELARPLGFTNITAIPVSALRGDNIVERSWDMPWFTGGSLIEFLETVDVGAPAQESLRLPIQVVLRAEGDFRGYGGQIASGHLKVGNPVLALPASVCAKISSLTRPDLSEGDASAPHSVTLTLDRPIDLSRGDMLVDPLSPPSISRVFRAAVVWMSQTPLAVQRPYLIRHTTRQVCAMVSKVENVFDLAGLETAASDRVDFNGIGTVIVETHQPLYCEPYRVNRSTGAFIFIDPSSNHTIGAGMISAVLDPGRDIEGQGIAISGGLTVWFTGLSGAGKTTITQAVYEKLWAKGLKVEILDGDVVRRQLSKDLGFSKEDRDENIRRIGFIAHLLNRNGVIVLVSAISPYRAIREEVRRTVGNFLEVYVNAPLPVCEQRDPKGHYRRARTGELAHFTGVTDPYEPPLKPDVECRTDMENLSESAAIVMQSIEQRLGKEQVEQTGNNAVLGNVS
ncbi:MAG: adenylyl-sulfate kinase [Bryobacteraceae bacterium]